MTLLDGVTPNCLPSKKATQKRLLNKGYLKKATQKRLLKKGYINKKATLKNKFISIILILFLFQW